MIRDLIKELLEEVRQEGEVISTLGEVAFGTEVRAIMGLDLAPTWVLVGAPVGGSISLLSKGGGMLEGRSSVPCLAPDPKLVEYLKKFQKEGQSILHIEDVPPQTLARVPFWNKERGEYGSFVSTVVGMAPLQDKVLHSYGPSVGDSLDSKPPGWLCLYPATLGMEGGTQ